MRVDRNYENEERTIRPLTCREIADRLHGVVLEVGGWAGEPSDTGTTAEPRWISSAELVRRVRRFIVYN